MLKTTKVGKVGFNRNELLSGSLTDAYKKFKHLKEPLIKLAYDKAKAEIAAEKKSS